MNIDKKYAYQLYGIAFFAGLATMAYEMLLGRALVPYFGGTIYTWGALISVFLLGMSVGFLGGGKLSLRSPYPTWLGTFLIAGGLSVAITPILLSPICLFLLKHYSDVRLLAVIAAVIFAFLPAALYAAISPFCVRLGLYQVNEAGATAGRFSALNTIGSIIGTLGTSFFLLPYMGSKVVFFLLGTTSIIIAPFIVPKIELSLNPIIRRILLTLFLFVFLLMGVKLFINYEANSAVIDSAESEYNNIYILQQKNIRLMKFGYPARPNVESAIDLNQPKRLVLNYFPAMMAGMLYAPHINRVAFVGLGGGQLPAYLARTLPTLKIDAAEIDKEVIRFAKKYFYVKESDNFKIYPEDGRLYLARTTNQYDVVFLDAYRNGFVPFHLLTKEFFELIKSKLTPTGVVVQNVEPNSLLLDSTVATLRAVFTQVDMYKTAHNIVLIAYMGDKIPLEKLGENAVILNEKYHPFHNPLDVVNTQYNFSIDDGARVLTDDFAPVEMLNAIQRHNAQKNK